MMKKSYRFGRQRQQHHRRVQQQRRREAGIKMKKKELFASASLGCRRRRVGINAAVGEKLAVTSQECILFIRVPTFVP